MYVYIAKVFKAKYRAKIVCENTWLEVFLDLWYAIFSFVLFSFIFFIKTAFGAWPWEAF